MLSTGGMLGYAEARAPPGSTAIVATETGMLHPLQHGARRTSTSSPPTRPPACRFMKMITLPKLRDALRDDGKPR